MSIRDLNIFLQDFFTANQCHVEEEANGKLHVHLTEEMDRVLMNRPFYWHYIKQMGFTGDPRTLRMVTDPNHPDEDGEMIHFGSPRLQQIMNHLKANERFTKLFEQVDTKSEHDLSDGSGTVAGIPLYPWLVLNMKISYQGKQKKDEIFSIGLHLLNGGMQTEMMELLKERSLQMGIGDYCYTISPIIKLQSGLKRIEAVVTDHIKKQNDDWANESKEALNEELQLLEHFYDGQDNLDTTNKQKEINEIKRRFEPKIVMQIINGGIFYLQN